ncbi:hypothetical protein P3102_15870 [Amycolatopsis sp. QT-25]|uniref:hypothetical protein n=1 Tax=Amycolatopsis sp. QT-25 TaxID=3034022 RepID=UPI0023EBF5E4|nr:hypothetical protein [Amycolatopsis sp. QT-25]WET82573.1 hypothetical protein P3102_15870 [Amycolatopsis sp. QT-25]
MYEVAEKPSLGGSRWYVLPDDTTYYEPFDGTPRPALAASSTLRGMPTWTEVAT